MKRLSAVMIGIILVLAALGTAYASGYTYTTLNYPGSPTYASGINDNGTIVGTTGDAFYTYDSTTGNYSPLLFYGGQTAANGYGINNAGTIVGTVHDVMFNTTYGFVTTYPQYTSLYYPNAMLTSAQGINNANTIVGYYEDTSGVGHGFTLSGTTWTPLNHPGAADTNAWGINNTGTIVGSYQVTSISNSLGFILNGTAWTTLSYPGAVDTYATAINDAGKIVGYYYDASGNTHGFSYSGGIYTPLDPPDASTTSFEALGINNAGDISGYYFDATGVHGFEAIPTPIPGALLLLGAGLLRLANYRRRKGASRS